MSGPVFIGDFAVDELADALRVVDGQVDRVRRSIVRHLEHGVPLRDRDQRRRLRDLRELYARRAVLRDVSRAVVEYREEDASW